MRFRSPKSESTRQCGATGPRYTMRTWPRGGCGCSSGCVIDMTSSLRRGVGGPRTERDLDALLVVAAHELDGDLVTGLLGPDQHRQLRSRRDGLAVEGRDDVLALQAGLLSRGTGFDVADHSAVIDRQPELVLQVGRDGGKIGDTKEGAARLRLVSSFAKVVEQRLDLFDLD